MTRDVVILACAISAGVHAALAPDAGASFAVAAGALALLAVGATIRPASALVLDAATVVFAALLVAYGLAITTGMPLLHPEPEPVAGLALATKAVEAVGLLAATTQRGHRTTWTPPGLHARFRSSSRRSSPSSAP